MIRSVFTKSVLLDRDFLNSAPGLCSEISGSSSIQRTAIMTSGHLIFSWPHHYVGISISIVFIHLTRAYDVTTIDICLMLGFLPNICCAIIPHSIEMTKNMHELSMYLLWDKVACTMELALHSHSQTRMTDYDGFCTDTFDIWHLYSFNCIPWSYH